MMMLQCYFNCTSTECCCSSAGNLCVLHVRLSIQILAYLLARLCKKLLDAKPQLLP
jgi:hypothetical protein